MADRARADRSTREAGGKRSARYADVEAFAMALPEVTQAPHHHFGSFRVRGRIFVTVPPGLTHLHVFVGDERRDEFLAVHDDCCERLLWGGKVVGLRVSLAQASLEAVQVMVRAAWEAKAPKARPSKARG